MIVACEHTVSIANAARVTILSILHFCVPIFLFCSLVFLFIAFVLIALVSFSNFESGQLGFPVGTLIAVAEEIQAQAFVCALEVKRKAINQYLKTAHLVRDPAHLRQSEL